MDLSEVQIARARRLVPDAAFIQADATADSWLDSDATMWWSHADGETYRHWITQAGLDIDEERFVPEGTSGHRLFWARKT